MILLLFGLYGFSYYVFSVFVYALELFQDLDEKRVKVEELKKKVDIEKAALSKLETVKNEAEAPEKEAKDKYDEMLKQIKAQKETEKMMTKSLEAFRELDMDKNEQ